VEEGAAGLAGLAGSEATATDGGDAAVGREAGPLARGWIDANPLVVAAEGEALDDVAALAREPNDDATDDVAATGATEPAALALAKAPHENELGGAAAPGEATALRIKAAVDGDIGAPDDGDDEAVEEAAVEDDAAREVADGAPVPSAAKAEALKDEPALAGAFDVCPSVEPPSSTVGATLSPLSERFARMPLNWLWASTSCEVPKNPEFCLPDTELASGSTWGRITGCSAAKGVPRH
jgi:hypothetical protein